MRVLQLGAYPPPHGGVQTNIVSIREQLRSRGIEAPVINITRFRKPHADDVYYPRSAWDLLRILLRLRADVVHLHIGGSVTARLLLLGLICCLLPGARAVLTLHSGGYPNSSAGKKARRWSLRGFVFRRFDAILAVNSEIEKMFMHYGVNPARVQRICPFVMRKPSTDIALPEHLAEFIESHRPLLLTVGLLEREYDLPMQIDALGRVREDFADAGLMIVGSGRLGKELRAHIENKDYATDVMLCGDVDHAVTLALIARADLMLRTTLFDGDAISVREALYLGIPVVATDNGMRPEGVDLIPKADPNALVSAIHRCINERRPVPPPAGSDRNELEPLLEIYQIPL